MDDETRPLDRLLALAEERGVDDADLDDAVHDIYSQKASNINNGGLSEQLAFLLAELGEEETEAMLRSMYAD